MYPEEFTMGEFLTPENEQVWLITLAKTEHHLGRPLEPLERVLLTIHIAEQLSERDHPCTLMKAETTGRYCDLEGHCFPSPQALAAHIGHTGHHVLPKEKYTKQNIDETGLNVTQGSRTGKGKQERYSEQVKRIMHNLPDGEKRLLGAMLGDSRRKTAGMKKRYSLAAVGEELTLRHYGPHLSKLNERYVNPPVDLVDDAKRICYEVKTFSANAKDIKVKNEIYKSGNYEGLDSTTVKTQWAKKNGYHLKTIVVVVSKDSYEIYERDGYGCWRPSVMRRVV